MSTLSEGEARARWCPFVRTGVNANTSVAVNRTVGMVPDGSGYYNVYQETRCIASGCMAWRWAHEPARRHEGYCGLAGEVKP